MSEPMQDLISGVLNPNDPIAMSATGGGKDLEPTEFDFDCDTLEDFPVKLTIGGEKRAFVLRELIGTQRDAFLNFTGGKMRYQKGKPAGLANFNNLDAFLVSLGLIPTDGKVALTAAQINAIPSRHLNKLADKLRDMSGLEIDDDDSGKPGEASEEAAKNG